MRLFLSTLLALTAILALSTAVTIGEQRPSGFRRSFEQQPDEEEADVEEDYEPQAQTVIGYRARQQQQQYDYSAEEEQEEQPQTYQQTLNRRQPSQQQTYISKNNRKLPKSVSEEELEEIEEPDRLTVLLEKSSFNCDTKTTGYYADDSVNCEVFHYCQDNQKHSWVCPDGFTFHQVHLICMPPSGENICSDSAKYHVVNDYLYKPINVEEHQSRPNVTLRYSERYYPETFYHDERQDYAEERIQSPPPQKQPVQIGFHSQQRKAPTPTPAPSPIPYRFVTQVPLQHQLQHQTVYRSPEDINISLQQRRPQIFLSASSTPKYSDEDYGYQ